MNMEYPIQMDVVTFMLLFEAFPFSGLTPFRQIL